MKTVKQVMPVEIDYAAIAEKTSEKFAAFVKEEIEHYLYLTVGTITKVFVEDANGITSIGVKVSTGLGSRFSVHHFNYFSGADSYDYKTIGSRELDMLQELLASDPS